MLKHFSRLPGRCIAMPLLLLGVLAGSGCGSTDGSRLLQPGGGYGGEGAAGATGGGSGGAAGTGGSGGAAELSDAGTDAAADASSASSCVVGPLDQYCALGDSYCPASYAQARAKSHEPLLSFPPLLILQQACSAPDGAARVRVSAVYLQMSRSYIFDPSSEQLVSVQIYDDLGGCGHPASAGFGIARGFYGEDLPGCSFSYVEVPVPPGCNVPADWRSPSDAGASNGNSLDAGTDAGGLAGSPYECIVAP